MEISNNIIGGGRGNLEEQGQGVVTKKKRRKKIAKIETKSSLQVTFTKRRQGLFRKAEKLRSSFDADVGIVVFSPAGKAFADCHRTNDAVLRRLVAYLDQRGGFWWDKVDVAKLEKEEELEEYVRALEAARKTVLARAKEMAGLSAGTPPQPQLLHPVIPELSRPCQSSPREMFDPSKFTPPPELLNHAGDQKSELEGTATATATATAEVAGDCASADYVDMWLNLEDFVCLD